MILAVLITAFLAGVSLVARGQKQPDISDPPLRRPWLGAPMYLVDSFRYFT